MKEPTNKTRHSRKNLLPLLLAVTGLLARGSVSHAATYATYDFSTYTPGNLVGQSSPAWAAVTAANYTGTSPIQVVSGVAQVRFGGATATLWQSAGVGVSDIPINAAGKVTYFAYEMKVINAYRSSSGNGDYVTGLSTAATFAGGTHNRIFLKKTADSTKFSFGMNCATGSQYNDDLLYSLNSAYTIVIKHEAINGTGTEGKNDKVSFYVKSATEGAESLVLIMTQSYDGTGTYRKADGTYAALAALTAVSEPTIFKSHGIFQRPAGSAGASNSVDISKITFGESLAEVGVNTTPTPSVPVVADATNAGTGGFTANWTAASSATGYDLDVFTDSELTVHLSGYPKSVGAVTTYSVTGPFASGATLYYKVRASNSAGYSTYSGVQTVSITDAPAVLVPTVTNSATSGTVTWTSGPDWIPNNPVSASNATVTFNGVLNDVLTANNDSAGNFQLNSLVFSNTGSGNLNLTGNPLQFVSSGGTNPVLAFATTATVLQSVVNNIQIDADLTVNQVSATVSNSIIAGIISGSGGISKIGAGYAYITGVNNSFGGPVTVRAGFLGVPTFGMSGQISSLGTNGTIYLGNSSETSQIRGTQSANQTSDKTIVLGGSGAFNYIENYGTTGTVLTLSGNIDTSTNGLKSLRLNPKNGPIVISGTIGANMPDNQLSLMLTNGTQQLTLTRSNAYNGGTYLQGGSLALSNSSALGTGLVNLYGVTITALTNINLTNNFQFAGAGVTASITATQKVDLTNQISGNIAGFMGVDGIIRINTSFATAYLANPTNTYSSVLITQGAIAADSLGVAGSPSPLGTSGTITFGNGGVSILKYLGSGETNAKTLAFAAGASQWSILEHRGTGPLKLTTPLKIERTSANTLILESQPSGSGELAGSITNVEGVDIALNGTRLAKSGTGDWILSASNDYRNTSVQEGRLIAENPNALPAARDVEMAGGTLLLNFSGDGATLGNLCLTNFKSSPNRYINTAVVPETFKFNSSTIDLGTNRSSTLVFSSATNWITNQLSNSNIVETYGQNQYLKVAKSSTGGKLYITNTNGVPLSRILNAENTNFTANITAQGLVYFNLPGNDAPAITTRGNFTVIENRTAVSIVTAFDPDMNALTYSIAGGSDGALFRIDSETGVLTFAYAPDYESPTDLGRNNVYNLTVVVSDGQLTDEKQIAVTLTNETDSPSDYKAGWLMANGLATNSDWSADPNSVGYSLATAYAFGLNPSVREGEPASLASSSAGSVKIVYLQRDDKDISGVTYTVKSGTDLAEGLNGTVTPSPSANQPSPPKPGYTQYEATYTAPAPATKGFLKVQAFVP